MMMRYPKHQIYPLELSPLYKLSNKRRLAELLKIEPTILQALAASQLTGQHRIFSDKKTGRFITEPRDKLAIVHKNLLGLLKRIIQPHYAHSAIKGRSYKTNAEAHKKAGNVLKIDIQKFFPSVKFHHIHAFFSAELKCSPDIATILTKLCTVQTYCYGLHLPTGSCISPLLSLMVNRRMFDEIQALVSAQSCQFTVYVDDITISGKNATRELLTQVSTRIHTRGYKYHKIKVTQDKPALITGLIVHKGNLHLPFKREKKIRKLLEALPLIQTPSEKTKALSSLVGRLSEAEQLDPKYKNIRLDVMSQYHHEWNTIIKHRASKVRMAHRQRASNAT